MRVTEMLITGFDGDEPVFAISLASGIATMSPTSTDENAETVLDEAWQEATDAFEAVWEILERLPRVQRRHLFKPR
jgi:hypothetical protein